MFPHDISLVAKTPGESSGSIGFLVKMRMMKRGTKKTLLWYWLTTESVQFWASRFLAKGVRLWMTMKTQWNWKKLNNIILGSVHMSPQPQFRPAPAAHAQLLPITECKSPLDARKLSTSPAVDVGGGKLFWSTLHWHPHSHDGLSVESYVST